MSSRLLQMESSSCWNLSPLHGVNGRTMNANHHSMRRAIIDEKEAPSTRRGGEDWSETERPLKKRSASHIHMLDRVKIATYHCSPFSAVQAPASNPSMRSMYVGPAPTQPLIPPSSTTLHITVSPCAVMYSPNHAAARGPRPRGEPKGAQSISNLRGLSRVRNFAVDTGYEKPYDLLQNQIAVSTPARENS